MARNLEKIIAEQHEELKRLLSQDVLVRAPMRRVDVESPLAQAVLGMRRSGKSVVCRKALTDAGVSFGYVDFDDEALSKITAEKKDILGRHKVRNARRFIDAGRKLGCAKLTLVTDREREMVRNGAQVVAVVLARDWLQ